MIKYIVICIGLSLFCFQSCKGQSKKDAGKRDAEREDTYVYVPSPTPYNFVRDNMYVSLPDSLGGAKVTGFAVLKASIDDKAEVKDFNIMKLVVKEANNRPLIDYFYEQSDSYDKPTYPEDVKRFYPFLKNYLNNLRITAAPGTKPEKMNKITLMVRFR